jgi:hypothetical protein
MLKPASTFEDYEKIITYGEIPVLISERTDLLDSIQIVNQIYAKQEHIQKIDNLLFVTNEEELKPVNLLINKLGKNLVNHIDACANQSSLALVCLYKDFTFERVGEILIRAYEKEINVSVLLGRDLASLSFFVAKQFLTLNTIEKTGLLFSHARMSESTKNEFRNLTKKLMYTIITEKDMQNFDLITCFDNNTYNRVIINTHGKEDHVNLGDYTLCGRNQACSHTDGLGRPRCGYGEKKCFKLDKKVIDIKQVKCEELFLLSCSNAPYGESVAYDSKYNILLNSIDGIAKSIIGASTVHGISLKEISIILEEHKDVSALFLNDVLSSETNIRPFIHFGLASEIRERLSVESVSIDQNIIETMNNLSRLLISNVVKNEAMNLKLKKLFLKCEQHLKKKNRAFNQMEQNKYDADLIHHIRSVERLFMIYLQNNSHELILKFGEVALVNNDFQMIEGKDDSCICGSKMTIFEKKGLHNSQFNVTVQLCNRCGEKKFIMENGIDFDIRSLKNVIPGDDLLVELVNNSDQKMPVGYFYPIYVQNDVVQPKDIQYLNKYERKIFNLGTKDTLPPQQYYLTFFTIYNMQITINREFFQVEDF